MRGRKNKISDSETSENNELSEAQFKNIETSENQNDDFSDLIENFQEMGLEPYQFEPRKSNWSTFDKGNYDENEIQEYSSLNAQEEFRADCLCCNDVDAISDEKFAGKFYSL